MSKSNGAGKMFSVFLSIIIALFLFSFVFRFVNSGTSPVEGFSVYYKGKEITGDYSGVRIKKGDEIKIESYSTESQVFKVKIVALGTKENDFDMTIEQEPYTWKSWATEKERDLTGALIQADGNKIIFSDVNFNDAVEYCDPVITLPDDFIKDVDYFKMIITVGDESISIGLGVYSTPDGVKIDPGTIIF